MADNAKVRNLIFIVLIILSLALAGGSFVLLQKERARSTDLQGQLQDVTEKQRITQNRLEESKKMISDLETKLREAEGSIEALNNDLQKEKAAKEEMFTQIDGLKSDLNNQKELRASLEKKLTQAQDEAKKAQTQLKELNTKKTELESRLKELEEKTKTQEAEQQSSGVELGKIVVNSETTPEVQVTEPAMTLPGPQESKASAQTLEGKVLVINRDYNFAVINLGNKDGVNIGSVFGVYSGDRYIGDLKVEKVHDSMSAAGFASTEVKDKINEGDRVVIKTP